MSWNISGRIGPLFKPLCVAGGLVAAFAGAGGTASAGSPAHWHKHRPSFPSLSKLARVFLPPMAPGEHALVYHVRARRFTLGDHVYPGGSGLGRGFNKSAYECVTDVGPIPRGEYWLTPREAPFFGERAWRVQNTPCRTGILVHSDDIGVRGRPAGESKGCAVVKAKYWPDFVRDMDYYRPTRIIVKP